MRHPVPLVGNPVVQLNPTPCWQHFRHILHFYVPREIAKLNKELKRRLNGKLSRAATASVSLCLSTCSDTHMAERVVGQL